MSYVSPVCDIRMKG